jgi:hypothetical protein
MSVIPDQGWGSHNPDSAHAYCSRTDRRRYHRGYTRRYSRWAAGICCLSRASLVTVGIIFYNMNELIKGWLGVTGADEGKDA